MLLWPSNTETRSIGTLRPGASWLRTYPGSGGRVHREFWQARTPPL